MADEKRRIRQPTFRLTVDGKDISRTVNNRLINLTLTDNREGEADQLDIELGDEDGLLDIPARGAEIRCWLGWEGDGLTDKGRYTVDEIEHSGAPDRLTIRARSADLREGIATKREQSWHGTTIGQIVETIAKRNKLTPSVAAKLAKLTLGHIDQTSESDISFLQRLAGQFDAIATVKQKNLIFLPMGQATTASGAALPTVSIARSSGDQHRFTAQDREACVSVRAYYTDHASGNQREIIVRDTTKKENSKTYSSAEDVKTLRHVYASKTNAKRAAEAALKKAKRGVAQFSINLAEGRPEITPELPATVSGFKPVIDGQGWIVTRVTHTLNDSGLVTALEMESRVVIEMNVESDGE